MCLRQWFYIFFMVLICTGVFSSETSLQGELDCVLRVTRTTSTDMAGQTRTGKATILIGENTLELAADDFLFRGKTELVKEKNNITLNLTPLFAKIENNEVWPIVKKAGLATFAVDKLCAFPPGYGIYSEHFSIMNGYLDVIVSCKVRKATYNKRNCTPKKNKSQGSA